MPYIKKNTESKPPDFLKFSIPKLELVNFQPLKKSIVTK